MRTAGGSHGSNRRLFCYERSPWGVARRVFPNPAEALVGGHKRLDAGTTAGGEIQVGSAVSMITDRTHGCFFISKTASRRRLLRRRVDYWHCGR